MPVRHTTQATGTNSPSSQISVNAWNEGHLVEDGIVLPNESPLPPAVDNLKIFARKIGGRMMLSQIGPSGLDTALQPNLGGNKVALWMPPGGATTVPGVFGMSALTAVGTATARTIATTNLLTRMTRLGYVSAAGANSVAGVREAVAKYTTGAGAPLGGFFYRARFGVSDAATVTGARMFVGLSANTAAPTNVSPLQANVIGVAQDAGDVNLSVICFGAAGAGVPLGDSFPVRAGSLDAYELALFAPASGGEVHWQVTRLNTGDIAQGTFSTNVPLGTQLLCLQNWRTNNATALAVGLDICGLYIETDY